MQYAEPTLSTKPTRDALGRFTGVVHPRGNLGKKHSPEWRLKISEKMRGREITWKKKISEANSIALKGRKLSDEHRRNIGLAKRGEHCTFWKGGITPKNALIRSSAAYRDWRRAVFERDDYTCQLCHVRGVPLHADHIKPFAYFVELRFDINNGRTLCVPCHKNTDTYLSRASKHATKH